MNAFTITEKENISEDINKRMITILTDLQNLKVSRFLVIFVTVDNFNVQFKKNVLCFSCMFIKLEKFIKSDTLRGFRHMNTCLFILAYLSANSAKIPTHVFHRQLTRIQYVKKYTLLNLTVSPLDSD